MDLKQLSNKELLDLKKKTENAAAKYKTQQMAYKILLNSCYGALGQQYFRFFSIPQAEAITLSGQLSIQWIAQFLNDYLNEVCETEDEEYVIYIDTDSNYLTLGKLIEKVGLKDKSHEEITDFLDKACEQIQNEIDKEYQRLADQMNLREQRMQMQREAIASRGFWTRKKRYALNVIDSEGVRYDEPKLKIMGLETARSSTPAICRKNLKEAIKLILTTDEETVIKFINKFKKEFMNLKPEEVATSTGVSNIDKFKEGKGYRKGTPIHVRGSIVYNNWVKENKLGNKYEYIRSGDKIKNIYLKLPNTLQENTLSFNGSIPKEMNLDDYVDYNMQYEKTFLNPLKTILTSVGWKHEKKRSLL